MPDSPPVETADQQVVVTRVFDAPRDVVFRAWTDPAQVAKWFGPQGMDIPRDSVVIDARVGGRFELRMVRSEMGFEMHLAYEIVELVEPELLVLHHEAKPELGIPHATVTRIEFHDEDGKTRMVLTDGPYPESAHAEAGWVQAFDKLAALLQAG
ncbi:MAG TPA: SRPBCC domain-containing protein [Thermoleophilaceae bacterium]